MLVPRKTLLCQLLETLAMKRIIKLLYLALSLLTRKNNNENKPKPVLWKPESISAEINADNVYLKIGKYLNLEQKLEPNEEGWSKSVIEIPDTWMVKNVFFRNEQLILQVKDSGEYQINGNNMGLLSYEILSAGNGEKTDDAKLLLIWEKCAKV